MSENKRKILLVEDDKYLIDIYTTELKKAEFVVKNALNGKEALNEINKIKPDLLVLDIIMPEVDGWQVLRKIKEKAEFKNLNIIVLSNLSQKEDIEKALKSGATKYFVKTHFTPSKVVEEIKKILNAD